MHETRGVAAYRLGGRSLTLFSVVWFYFNVLFFFLFETVLVWPRLKSNSKSSCPSVTSVSRNTVHPRSTLKPPKGRNDLMVALLLLSVGKLRALKGRNADN